MLVGSSSSSRILLLLWRWLEPQVEGLRWENGGEREIENDLWTVVIYIVDRRIKFLFLPRTISFATIYFILFTSNRQVDQLMQKKRIRIPVNDENDLQGNRRRTTRFCVIIIRLSLLQQTTPHSLTAFRMEFEFSLLLVLSLLVFSRAKFTGTLRSIDCFSSFPGDIDQ